MTTAYIQTPLPFWPIFNTDAKLLIGGYMFTYRSAAPLEPKPVYQDPGGTLPYENPLPIRVNGTLPPMFFADDEPYLVQFRETSDPQSRLVDEVDNFTPPGNGGGNVTTLIDTFNHFLNPQFDFPRPIPSPLPNTPVQMCDNWYFYKSNTNATDTLTIEEFILGATPEGTPKYKWVYECTGVGAGGETFKDIYSNVDRVTGFAGEQISLGFQLQSDTESTVEVIAIQRFGSGGTPSTEVITLLGTFTLTNTFAKYTLTEIIPSIAGKTLGTNGDDVLQILLRLPLNAICSVQGTNAQDIHGDLIPPFEHQTQDYNNALLRGSWLPRPNPNGSQQGLAVIVDSNNKFTLGVPGAPGQLIALAYDATEDSGIFTGWLKINSATVRNVSRTTYSRLFAVLGTIWGAGDGSTTFGLPPLGGALMMCQNPGGGSRATRTVGQVIGAESHALSIDEMPSHNHIQKVFDNGTIAYTTPGGTGARTDYTQSTTASTEPLTTFETGGGQSFPIINPANVVCVMIKY